MNRSGLFLAAAVALAVTGCPKPPAKSTDPQRGNTGAKADPWETAAKRLAKETDPAGVRGILIKLTEDLSARADAAGPPALTPDATKGLAAIARLAPEDLDIVGPGAYSGGDAAYVAECLYLRDAARSVDPVGLPPAERAKAAFAWVCRQVYVQTWITDQGQFVPAVPPTYILRRGWGSALERAYVSLALFQQLGLDAGLVGPPDAGDKSVGTLPPWLNAKDTPTPPGPFWAVAVRVDKDVLLFDPAAGRAFPAPLAQVKANPDLLKPWADDKAQPWKVPADVVKQATVFLTAPLPALSPRMAALEEKTKADLGADLAVDLKGVQERFNAAPRVGEVKGWNPAGDGLAYPRVLASFLPADEGGTDRRPQGQRLLDLYMGSRFPREMFVGADVLPRGIAAPAVRDRLILAAAGGYEQAFLANPTPRERMQRGQLQDATRFLSDRQDGFTRGQEQARNITSEQIDQWVTKVNEVYAALRKAEYPDPTQTRPNPPTDPAVAAARALVEEFWRQTAPVAQAIVARANARTGLAEASYLLAVAKHEEAERQQLRAEKATGADAARAKATASNAWAEAANTWRSYLDQGAALPGLAARNTHARALAARAEALAPKAG